MYTLQYSTGHNQRNNSQTLAVAQCSDFHGAAASFHNSNFKGLFLLAGVPCPSRLFPWSTVLRPISQTLNYHVYRSVRCNCLLPQNMWLVEEHFTKLLLLYQFVYHESVAWFPGTFPKPRSHGIILVFMKPFRTSHV